MRYAFIRNHRQAFPVNLMCQVLEMSKSGFYAWLKRSESPRNRENRGLLVEIKAVHHRSWQMYGTPRVHVDLKASGHVCGRHRVAQLMCTYGIVSRHKRKFRATTNFRFTHPVKDNLLQRQFTVSQPNHWWVSDITYSAPSLRRCHGRHDRSVSMFGMWKDRPKEGRVHYPFFATEKREPKRR